MSTPEDTTPDDETLRRLDILKRTVNAIVEGKRRADPEKVDRGRQDYERDLVILSEHQPGPLAEQLKREMGEGA